MTEASCLLPYSETLLSVIFKKMNNNEEKLNNLRHSCAHLLAAAVMELWPDSKRTIGPAIESGFYYDFEFAEPIAEEDLPKIEKKMAEILPAWDHFEHREITESEAKELFKENPYKLELISEIVEKKEPITIYTAGKFDDLCRGGHSENPAKDIGAFKLLSIAGAYWKGSEKNKMLTRIYGTAFPTEQELDKHLWQLEEAKKRDHRKLGKELGIFAVSDEVGQGLILWLPNGTIIKEELENWGKDIERRWGYKRVSTPNITKSGLYYTSGHLPYYKEDMYPPMIVDKNEEYYLKPMNCPHHHMIYKAESKSYKDLPFRLAEFGTCYRYEASGQLYGLMRVRGFTQNDAHIYTTLDQAVDEFVSVMKLHEYYYQALGITEYHLELGLRDPKNTKKCHGDEKMWELAEKLTREAAKRTGIKMVEVLGNAAFYGPKIDFIIHSAIGREFAISTNQIDMYMGPRFNLKYTDPEGKDQIPVIIHRAPLGSDERFIGFLIEHFGGAFPTWLAPVQVQIIPIADRHQKYAQIVLEQLKDSSTRVEVDNRQETMQSKTRDAQNQKIPYMIILGDREEKDSMIAVRTRAGENLGAIPIKEFLEKIKLEVESKV